MVLCYITCILTL